jgi:DNA modification methylase
MNHGRNSVGFEIDKTYAEAARKRIENRRTLEMTTEIVGDSYSRSRSRTNRLNRHPSPCFVARNS